MLKRVVLTVALTIFCASMACCGGPSTKRLSIQVSLAESLRNDATFTVDIIGAPEGELAEVEAAGPRTYFSTANNLRERQQEAGRVAEGTLGLGAATPDVYRLEKNDEIWKTWRRQNITDLIVIVQPTVPMLRQEGSKWSQRIPLMSDRWQGTDLVRLRLTPAGLILETPPKAIAP